jgi:phosphate/phosphite/phosphonate ABC transporter binding protein
MGSFDRLSPVVQRRQPALIATAIGVVTLLMGWSVLGADLRLAFSPGEDPAHLKKRLEPLRDWLSVELKKQVEFKVPASYSELTLDLVEGRVDMAFMTALTFVTAQRRTDLRVLLKKVWDAPTYHSVILSRRGFRDLKSLRGRRFGFVDRQSTSGFLYAAEHLRSIGLPVETAFSETAFLGNHETLVQALRDEQVDAVATFSNDPKGRVTAWERHSMPKRQRPRLLWVGPAIPTDPLVVRSAYYRDHPQLVHELTFQLLDGLKGPKGEMIRESLGIRDLMLASSGQYHSVGEVLARHEARTGSRGSGETR